MKKTLRLVAVFALMGAALAYTGCTDYSKDFDEINNRIEALESGKLKSVEDQIAGLKSTVESLEAAKKTAEEAIKGLQDKSETAANDIKTLNAEIEKLNKAIADAKTLYEKKFASIDDQIKAINAWQVDVLATIGAIKGRVETLEGGLKTAQADILKLIADLKTANDRLDETARTITTLQTEMNTIKVALETIQKANYLTATEAAELYQTEAEVKEAIKDAIEAALKNNGVISAEIAKAVKAATDNLQSQIDALKKNVAELAGRIQSIVYVPEFANGAKAYVYKLGTTTVSKYTKATFKVTPANCAAALSKLNTVVLFAETKAADYTDLEIASLDVISTEKGLVEVTVNQDLSGNAFAIGVKMTNAKAGESGIETGADITSDFAPVAAAGTPSQIENMIVLYNRTTKREYATVNTNMQALKLK